ncbi:MAG: UDP-3-O-(3-hydroxymyristoyl)glucosamine N-acyltransferase [Candidatus Eisenbacteria bacterium]|nr:UDP-3-O-(3-hydroxymyristoyl)glucosamine N-acyltransferase [Candidatus Eisenbacteria bacterium]
MNWTLDEVAKRIGGTVVGDGSVELTGVSGIREAQPGHLTFLSNPKYARYLETTRASAVIVDASCEGMAAGGPAARLVTGNAYASFARAVRLFTGEEFRPPVGAHPAAHVAPGAMLGHGVAVGPHAIVMDGARIGEGTVVHGGAYIAPGAVIGRDCVIYPNVTVKSPSVIGDRVIVHAGSVIGCDGFGFAREGGEQVKVPQVGNVVIEDDVEVGANVCIARATLGTTRVGRGTKIDNLVQIAHNVVIGEGSIIVAQVGICGSAEIGDHVVLAGQAGIAGHLTIGDGAVVGAQAGVTKSVPPGERVSGYPARRHALSKRLNACIQALPDLLRRVREVERRLAASEKEGKC